MTDLIQPMTVPLEGSLPVRRILLAWPHEATDWAPMLAEVRECYRRMILTFLQWLPDTRIMLVSPPGEAVHGVDTLPRVEIIPCLTNDTWTRDYGPVTAGRDTGHLSLNDFAFNGWGLKFAADRDNLTNKTIQEQGRWRLRDNLDYVLEGGSIESDGRGTILTTSRCLLSPNRNGSLTKAQVERQLRLRLGARRVLWLDHGALGGDDTDSHVDTLARFVAPDTIAYVKSQPGDADHPELARMEAELEALRQSDKKPYALVPLPLPHPITDQDGEQLPATYANFLITDRAVFMPTYGQPERDAEAMDILTGVFAQSRRPVVGIDCRPLIHQHGSLHCATMQLYN